jgi:hypothetical protein
MLTLLSQAASTQPTGDTPWERIVLAFIGAALTAWLAYLARGQKEQTKRLDTVDQWQRQALLMTPPPSDPSAIATRPTTTTEPHRP